MVVVSQKIGRKYRTNGVLNPGPVVCESITLSSHPQLLPYSTSTVCLLFDNDITFKHQNLPKLIIEADLLEVLLYGLRQFDEIINNTPTLLQVQPRL